jgi:kynurenine formamidase
VILKKVAATAFACLIAVAVMAITLPAQTSHTLVAADLDKLVKELSNWGRWGKADEKGAINLITSTKRKSAARLVLDGVSVSLSRDYTTEAAVDNPRPFVHKMSPPVANQFNMDEYTIFFHGNAYAHFDALSHVFYKGQMYNGFPETDAKVSGMAHLGVTVFREGLLTRGVLVDIPRLRNLPYLEPDAVIYPEDLDAWEKKTGIHIESGDAVIVRTGRWARRAAKGAWDIGAHSAGLHASTAKWFHQRDIALLAGDTSNDAIPSRIVGVDFPLHTLLLVAMGTPMMDQCDLEELAQVAAAKNRWTFLFTAAPLRAAGGTGAPLNPIATF